MDTTMQPVTSIQTEKREARSVVRDRLDQLAASATARTDMLSAHLYLDLIGNLDKGVQTSSAYLEILKDAYLQTQKLRPQRSDVEEYLKEINSMIVFLQKDLQGA